MGARLSKTPTSFVPVPSFRYKWFHYVDTQSFRPTFVTHVHVSPELLEMDCHDVFRQEEGQNRRDSVTFRWRKQERPYGTFPGEENKPNIYHKTGDT